MADIPDFENVKKWYEFFKTIIPYTPLLLLFGLIIIIFTHPSEIQIWVSNIQRLFANRSIKMSKKSIENELEGRVLKVSKQMSQDLEDVLPYSVKIEWVTETNKKAFFDDNQVIICMDHNKTRNQNIVYAINDYVEHGLLPAIKLQIDETLMKSSRLVLTRKLIQMAYKQGIYYFIENIFNKEIGIDLELKNMVEQLIRLDDSGMFVQILLREFKSKGAIYAQGTINENFKKETKKFMQFLFNIANREPHEINELQFSGDFFKVGIILVANIKTFDTYGYDAYMYRFNEKLKLGVDSIYLCSRSDLKVTITQNLSKQVNKKFKILDNPKVFYYNGRYKDQREFKGVCLAYNNMNATYVLTPDQFNNVSSSDTVKL